MKFKIYNQETGQLEDPPLASRFNYYMIGYVMNFMYIVLMAFILKTFMPLVLPVVTLGLVHYTIILILLDIIYRYLAVTGLDSFISNLFNFLILICIYFFVF